MSSINDIEYSHFEDTNGNHFHLNGHDCVLGEITHIFALGKLHFYIAVENGLDIDLKLIPKPPKQIIENNPQPITFVKSKFCPKDQEYLIDQIEAYFERWPNARKITDRDSFTSVMTFRFSSFAKTSHVHVLYYPDSSSHIRILAMVNNKLKPIGYFKGI